jgi:hypothetical protein
MPLPKPDNGVVIARALNDHSGFVQAHHWPLRKQVEAKIIDPMGQALVDIFFHDNAEPDACVGVIAALLRHFKMGS